MAMTVYKKSYSISWVIGNLSRWLGSVAKQTHKRQRIEIAVPDLLPVFGVKNIPLIVTTTL